MANPTTATRPAPSEVTWALVAISESGKTVLKCVGQLPAAAQRLVDDLGYAQPDDLQVSALAACLLMPVCASVHVRVAMLPAPRPAMRSLPVLGLQCMRAQAPSEAGCPAPHGGPSLG